MQYQCCGNVHRPRKCPELQQDVFQPVERQNHFQQLCRHLDRFQGKDSQKGEIQRGTQSMAKW